MPNHKQKKNPPIGGFGKSHVMRVYIWLTQRPWMLQ